MYSFKYLILNSCFQARLKLLSNNTKKGTVEQEHILRIIDTTLLKCYLNVGIGLPHASDNKRQK